MNDENSSGLKWRIAFSIISSMIWLIFIVAWVGFGWNDFETGENIAVLCISSVVWLGSNGLVWAIWPSSSNDKDEAG
ncbi:MAG: hypothetical protein BMS9Abin28_1789 [Anaerolineae bacterium]|nr:MAG: hypothetical protein BMS9Abin28_1789 [Anaerolineae bacterium]